MTQRKQNRILAIISRVWGFLIAVFMKAISYIPRVRRRMAPVYRRLRRGLLVFIGFGTFIGAELALAKMINSGQYYLLGVIFAVLLVLAIVVVSPAWGFILWLFLSPFAKYGVRTFTKYNVGFDFILLGSLVIAILFRKLLNRQQPSKLILAEWLMVGSFIYGTIIRNSSLSSPDILSQLLLTPLVVYFIAKSTITKVKHISWYCYALLGIGTVWAILGIYEHFTGASWLSLAFGRTVQIHTGVGEGRSLGPAGHYYLYGNGLILSLVIATHWAIWVKNSALKILYYVLLPILLLGLYFGYSRAPFLACILVLLIVTALARASFKKYVTTIIALCFGITLLAPFWLTDKFLLERLGTGTPYARLATNVTSMNMLRENLLFGVGLNHYAAQVPFYVSSRKHSYRQNSPMSIIAYWGRPHSEYFLIFCEQGIIGGFLYFGAIIAFLVRVIRIRARLSAKGLFGKEFAGCIIAFTFGVLLTMITDEFQRSQLMYYIMFILFATAVRLDELSAAAPHEIAGNNSARVLVR